MTDLVDDIFREKYVWRRDSFDKSLAQRGSIGKIAISGFEESFSFCEKTGVSVSGRHSRRQ